MSSHVTPPCCLCNNDSTIDELLLAKSQRHHVIVCPIYHQVDLHMPVECILFRDVKQVMLSLWLYLKEHLQVLLQFQMTICIYFTAEAVRCRLTKTHLDLQCSKCLFLLQNLQYDHSHSSNLCIDYLCTSYCWSDSYRAVKMVYCYTGGKEPAALQSGVSVVHLCWLKKCMPRVHALQHRPGAGQFVCCHVR